MDITHSKTADTRAAALRGKAHEIADRIYNDSRSVLSFPVHLRLEAIADAVLDLALGVEPVAFSVRRLRDIDGSVAAVVIGNSDGTRECVYIGCPHSQEKESAA